GEGGGGDACWAGAGRARRAVGGRGDCLPFLPRRCLAPHIPLTGASGRGAPGGPRSSGQVTASAETAPAASITARPGTIFRSARVPRDPLPVPKLAAPAPQANAVPPLAA